MRSTIRYGNLINAVNEPSNAIYYTTLGNIVNCPWSCLSCICGFGASSEIKADTNMGDAGNLSVATKLLQQKSRSATGADVDTSYEDSPILLSAC